MITNIYALELFNKEGLVIERVEIPVSEKAQLTRVMKRMAKVGGAKALILTRGSKAQAYVLRGENDLIADEELPKSKWVPSGTPMTIRFIETLFKTKLRKEFTELY